MRTGKDVLTHISQAVPPWTSGSMWEETEGEEFTAVAITNTKSKSFIILWEFVCCLQGRQSNKERKVPPFQTEMIESPIQRAWRQNEILAYFSSL